MTTTTVTGTLHVSRTLKRTAGGLLENFLLTSLAAQDKLKPKAYYADKLAYLTFPEEEELPTSQHRVYSLHGRIRRTIDHKLDGATVRVTGQLEFNKSVPRIGWFTRVQLEVLPPPRADGKPHLSECLQVAHPEEAYEQPEAYYCTCDSEIYDDRI